MEMEMEGRPSLNFLFAVDVLFEDKNTEKGGWDGVLFLVAEWGDA